METPQPEQISSVPGATEPTSGQASLACRYRAVREFTESLCRPLATEDYVVQTMPDVSPTKWHLAHTSWFFETFVLGPMVPDYRPYHPRYSFLFNSYYNAIGDRHSRPKRGQLSRPTVAEVYAYREYLDEQMLDLLEGGKRRYLTPPIAAVVELGINHEQQHQELIVTDIKHVFASSPLYPVFDERKPMQRRPSRPLHWVSFEEGVHWIGHEGPQFAFDNESPQHRELTEAFRLGSRLITNGEYKGFIADGGYGRHELWLADGWSAVHAGGWRAPLFWQERDGSWWQMTLAGLRPVEDDEPVCHVSYFEADAYARWDSSRLPSEAEWEVASTRQPVVGNFVEDGYFHPLPLGGAPPTGPVSQIFGDVWEWTRSAYSAYPGYYPGPGALGEYNGKFMNNRFVLRGGSCATPRNHIRATYRNFFPPDTRWQFTGIRLAREA